MSEAERRTRLSAPARALLLAAAAVVSMFASLLAAEVALFLYFGRGAGPGTLALVEDYDSAHLFHVQPHTSTLEAGIEYRTNNLGMRRDRDVPMRPDPGVVRILSYGDSIANGWGVPHEQTYTFLLESALNVEGGIPFEVLNMYRGVSPTIASFHIRRDVKRLHPHAVLLEIELLNDTSDEALVEDEGRDAYGLPLRTRRARYVVDWEGHLVAPLPSPGRLIERTKLWAFLSQYLGKLRSRLQSDAAIHWEDPLFADASGRPHYYYNMIFDRFLLDQRAIEAAFDRMFESLAGIHRFLDFHGVQFLLILVPSKYAYYDGPFHQTALEVFRRAEARARELGLPSLSVYEALREAGGDRIFMDFCHPTAAGNQAMARALLPRAREWGSR